MSIIELPTKTAPMREAIILALAKLHDLYPEDTGYLSTHIREQIAELSDRAEMVDYDFDMRAATGKAYYRAFDQLRDAGVVVVNADDPNEIEYMLSIYVDAP